MKNQRRSAKPVGHMIEGKPERKRSHPPKPHAHYVIVPKGSRWECSSCGVVMPADIHALQLGSDVICEKCVKGGRTE